ncbi:MAG: histidine--tRNA ligase [Odoribacter sp.]|nr:histidine--tRNA ligase [Odoribacter sp.]
MAQTPSIPKGTRDYSPEIMVKRNYIFDTIKSVFKLYGYMPLETPAMENLSTLMGKYGDEGDKLLFKILNSGDFLSNIPETELAGKNSLKLTNKISEKGLRYDLTVPFARFVVQHQSEISFPFKRYQIQPVWRADRPQKGRYREFYQCDVDVVGSDSLLNEVELIQIVDEVYRRLKLRVRLLINNRKVLAGIAEIIGYPEKLTDITVAIDKMDKIGIDNVNAELREKGLTEEAILKLQPILNLEGDTKEKLQQLRTILQNSPTGLKGIEELTQVFSYLNEMPLQTEIKLDLTLARGLSYYTGAIFEVKALDAEMGSITGGGRYDDLTGIFGLKNVSGVGISFGADRIFDVMTQLDLFPEDANTTTRILFVNFGEKEECFCLPLLRQLRNEGINAEIYPEAAKMKKQMTYADRKKIPFVALVGENEIKEGTVSLKNMSTGEQANIKTDELAVHLK